MANRKQTKHKRQLNMDTFSDGIKGKVLEAVSISNELECRYISLEFEDKTELTNSAPASERSLRIIGSKAAIAFCAAARNSALARVSTSASDGSGIPNCFARSRISRSRN
jgi:hypothetical protein